MTEIVFGEFMRSPEPPPNAGRATRHCHDNNTARLALADVPWVRNRGLFIIT